MLVPREDLLDSLDDGVPLLCDLTEYYPFRVPVTICSQKYVVLFGSAIDTPHTHTPLYCQIQEVGTRIWLITVALGPCLESGTGYVLKKCAE